MQRGLLFHGDGRDLDFRSTNPARDLHCGPGRFWIGHELLVDLVHLRDIIQVRDVDGHGDDVRHLKARLFDHPFDGCNGIRGLGRDIGSFELAVRGPLLACDLESIARYVAVAEGHTRLEVDRLVLREDSAAAEQCKYDDPPDTQLSCCRGLPSCV